MSMAEQGSGPPPIRRSRKRRFAFSLIVAALALTLPLVAGEVAVRIVYRDGGRTTLGGPGPYLFVHRFIDPVTERRTPVESGPKRAGVERILVQGDSITWGVGVRDWQQIYPNRLLNLLQRSGRQFDMAAFARAGKNIDGHAKTIAETIVDVDPDYVIYQWYHNDIEVGPQVPRWPMAWHRWPGYSWMASHSWLAYVVDNQLTKLCAAHGWGGRPSYDQFLIEHYAEGTPGWTRFADQFHRWAAYADAYAGHVLVFLYPQVPFRGQYPLRDLNRRVRAFATPHSLTYPAYVLGGAVGREAPDPSGTAGRVRKSDGFPGLLVAGPSIPLESGHYELAERIRLDAAASGTIESVDVIADDKVVAHRDVNASECARPGEWTLVKIAVDLAPALTRHFDWRIHVSPGVFLSVDSVSVPIAYKHLDALDPRDRLNTFNTHASAFDAHPNARAHAEIAQILAQWILSRR
jgi:lysophospholipase L1-like esterase